MPSHNTVVYQYPSSRASSSSGRSSHYSTMSDPNAGQNSSATYRDYTSQGYTTQVTTRGSTTVVQGGQKGYGSSQPSPNNYGGGYRRGG